MNATGHTQLYGYAGKLLRIDLSEGKDSLGLRGGDAYRRYSV